MLDAGTSVNGGNRPPRGNGEGVAQASPLPNTCSSLPPKEISALSTTLKIFSCEKMKPTRRLVSELKQVFPSVEAGSLLCRLCYLDTFDWRLYNRGWVLEVLGEKGETRLVWRDMNSGHIHGIVRVDSVPVFSKDLPKGNHWTQLGEILDERALMSVVCSDIEGQRVVLRNGEGKTVVGMELHSADDNDWVSVKGSRGFEKGLKKALDVIESKFHCEEPAIDPAQKAFETGKRKPGTYQPKPPSGNDPTIRTDEACKEILMHLIGIMCENESGIRKQIDTEFLHDFRVAVRRSRSLLGQVKGIFPKPREQRFRRELAWLQEITGPLRDMDVYLLEFSRLQRELPADKRQDLLPMRTFLIDRQRRAHRDLIRALDSSRYRTFVRDWRAFLERSAPRYTSLPNASTPIAEMARERISKLFRQAIREGEAITDTNPATDLHELRKTCKKLRYLLEFFGGLFSAKKIDTIIKALKVLQDNLGTYQDLQVQQESLLGFEKSMSEEGALASTTSSAMEALVTVFAEREQLVRSEFSARFEVFSKENKKLFKTLFRS
uniref:CHAD domain-containing protein n=1 Tax=Candidatus Kentrum sp. LFY TaxID=2126342 RepID=A0A450UP45_9GAMM|nr:MAG: CHAD domain-containing protein [Candidatus Kentron sp. LFY]